MYTHTTFAQFKSALSSRLEGTYGESHWIDDELSLYTIEALRTWGLLTGFWRERGLFDTSPGVALYDINTLSSLAPLTGYEVTDADTIAVMQYMLCEPRSATGAGMSTQYAFSDLVSALQRARNQLINDTIVTVQQRSIAVPADAASVALPDTVISIRRTVWISADGVCSNVHWTDETEAASYNQLYPLSPATPEMYSILSAPPLTVHLIPPPVDSGTLSLITAETQSDLNPATPVLMNVPDDCVWVARELAMADVLGRDGPGHDPIRASYARKRYELGVSLVNQMAQIVFVEFEGLPVIPSGLAEIDYAYAVPHWQSAGTGTPTDIGTIAGNMIGLRRVPDRAYSIALDVIRKAPIPVLAGDFVQIAREDLTALLDGSQSYALFKLGGSDLAESSRLFQSMLTAAARYNARLSTLGVGWGAQEQSRWNDQSFPETGSGMGVGALNPADMASQGSGQGSGGGAGSGGGGR
jgi:hypothetical protein